MAAHEARLTAELVAELTALGSPERAIAHPVKCAEAVARFTGGQVPEDLDELVEFMKPESYKPVNEEIGQNVAQDEADDSN